METAISHEVRQSSLEVPSAPSHICPGCNGKDLESFLEVPRLPVNVGYFLDTAEAALASPVASITLNYCNQCGLVHNHAFAPDGEIFHPGYEVSLRHSETFRKFIHGVAERLVEQFDLHGKKITEIGCGDAYFLESLAVLGENDCFGIDPTIVAEGKRAVKKGSLNLERGYFSDRHIHHETDFICCLSVFEDIPNLPAFLKNVHALAARNNAPVYFEVFNGWRAFEQGEVWSVHFEQCNYFSLESLKNVFIRHGFKIRNSGTCYSGDQYLFIEADAVAEDAVRFGPIARNTSSPEILSKFSETFKERKKLWEERLLACRARNQKIVLWGTGGKGITFLNSVSGADVIEWVVEINPDKHGKHLPVTGQKIVPPEALADIRPDKIIITNPIYKREMMEQAATLGVTAEFLIA